MAVRAETGWNLDEWAADHEWRGVGIGPVGQTRDSDALERSNFEVILEDLTSRFPDQVDVVRFNHWACGWVEEIAWEFGPGDVMGAVTKWATKLENYPVANEEHYSDLEWTENHPSESECFSDDPDCPCPARVVHLEFHDGVACMGNEILTRCMTGDANEITCSECLTYTDSRRPMAGQLTLSI